MLLNNGKKCGGVCENIFDIKFNSYNLKVAKIIKPSKWNLPVS